MWLLLVAMGINNGLNFDHPPMGWRSWNAYGININEERVQRVADAMSTRQRPGGRSLLDLGYVNLGIDDGWQDCHASQAQPHEGFGGFSYHTAMGAPIVHSRRFPSGLKDLVRNIHRRGLRAGWYLNTCMCGEFTTDVNALNTLYHGDVRALSYEYQFDSVKLDACTLSD